MPRPSQARQAGSASVCGSAGQPRREPAHVLLQSLLSGVAQIAEALCLSLSTQDQLGCQKTMVLGHRRFGAIHDICDELWAVGQSNIVAVDAPRRLVVNQKEMITSVSAG